MVKTVSDEKPTPNPGLELMHLCACRSCGDLAPGAIKEIDRLRAAIGEIERGFPLSALNFLLNAQEEW